MSFHARLVGGNDIAKIPVHHFIAALELFFLTRGDLSVAQLELEFGLDGQDAEWTQFKQMYANATDKQQFLRIAKNTMYLAEGGKFNMDDSGAFFANLAAVTSGV